MSVNTPNMGLIRWTAGGDPYDHVQLAANFQVIDEHDHTTGKGARLKGDSIEGGSIGTAQLADGSVTDVKLAGGITVDKLAHGVLGGPGDFKYWWRPSNATAIPAGGWIICAGQTLTASEHEFEGGGTIQIPNLIKRTIFGVEVGNIGEIGGASTVSFNHSHEVAAHIHSVPAHTHSINLESGFNAALNTLMSQNLSGSSWVHAGNHEGEEHRHSINGSVNSSGPWESGAANPRTDEFNFSASNIPPFVGFLPLLRVKF